MTVLWYDSESFCETPIAVGAYRYSEDAEIMIVTYAYDDEPVQALDLTAGEASMADLQAIIDKADVIRIANSNFDRVLHAAHGVTIPVEKIEDSMVVALLHSLPGSLDKLCDVLKVPTDLAKHKEGKKLIRLFCSPRPKNMKLRRATRETHPVEWQQFIDYAKSDIEALREVWKRLPKWNFTPLEREYWLLDQRINDRGIAVDTHLAQAALRAFDRTKADLAERATELTDGDVTSLTQRDRFLNHLAEEHDFATPDLKKGTVNALLKSDTLSPEVRELLEMRQQAAASSPAKYRSLLGSACSDGRLRGTIQFSGASRTNRDAGRIFQGQNLPRPTYKSHVIEAGIRAMKLDIEDLIFENVSELCVNAVRGCLVAADGKKLVVADLSNIEGRITSWFAGEDWKLQAFKDYDTVLGHDSDGKAIRKGPDLYKVAYSRSFNVSVDGVTGDQRQIGKTSELAGGFGGSVGAYVTMASNLGVKLTDISEVAKAATDHAVWAETAERFDPSLQLPIDVWTGLKVVVDAWRRAHPRTVSFWYDLERACKDAIRDPDARFTVRNVQVDMKDGYLRIRRPSGTYLSYKDAHLSTECMPCEGTGKVVSKGAFTNCKKCGGTGEGNATIRFSGMNQYTKKWETLTTYSGRLFENLVQSTARDIFMCGLKRAEIEGYPVVLRVHDELCCETPNEDAYTETRLSEMMAANPGWATGLPLSAAGHTMFRYAKMD